MEKIKEQFDIIFLLDSELGIDSDHENERPCLVISIDIDTEEGYVLPLTSKYRPDDINRMQYQLASGSWIDLSNAPIKITAAQLKYSRLSDKFVDGSDIEELEYRFQEWMD